MLVKDCMTRHPVMVPPTMMAAEAEHLMHENRIRHLPVVGDGKRLVGLVDQLSFALDPGTLGSLDMWEITRYLSRMTVSDVMTPVDKVVLIEPERTIERAARYMVEQKASCLPVVEHGDVVVGILTEVDLLHVFQLMLGLPYEGVRVTMRMPDRPGEFAKLSAVLGEQKWGVMGIGTFPTPRHEGYFDAVIKIRNVSAEKARIVLGQVPDQEIVDIRDVA
jgi:acetoin utilization protein AcuB